LRRHMDEAWAPNWKFNRIVDDFHNHPGTFYK